MLIYPPLSVSSLASDPADGPEIHQFKCDSVFMFVRNEVSH